MFKKFTIFFAFIILACLPVQVFGLSFELVPNPAQSYVDVFINTEQETINGISGELGIIGGSIAGILDAGSIVEHWIDQPIAKKGASTVMFSGIIPGGFGGYLNATGAERYGLLFRVIVEPKNTQNKNVVLNFSNILATKNDGTGTVINVGNASVNMVLSADSQYTTVDTNPPEISYEIVSDPNLFEGRKTLIFSVTDNESGFKQAFVGERRGEFEPAQSPQVLKYQYGLIMLRVIDNAGNANEVVVRHGIISYLAPYLSGMLAKIIAALIVLGILITIALKKKKKSYA